MNSTSGAESYVAIFPLGNPKATYRITRNYAGLLDASWGS
jgi:hypothetical protein